MQRTALRAAADAERYTHGEVRSMKHTGSLTDLVTTIKGCGFSIEQVLDQEHGHQVRTSEGAIVNWYPSKGTLVFQGPREQREKIQSAWASYTGAPAAPLAQESVGEPAAPANPATANKKVFLVHGHDVAAREQLELVLHKLGLDPFVLANTGGGGLTIIEALEAEIGPR